MWAWPISLATSSLLVSFIHDNVLVLYESITVRLERYRDVDQQMEAPVGLELDRERDRHCTSMMSTTNSVKLVPPPLRDNGLL